MHTSPLGRVLLFLSAAYLLPSYVLAETVYKSADSNGKITYSSSPPENHQQAEKINILPPPSEQAVKAAHERHQKNLRTGKTLNENRHKRSQQIAEDIRIKGERKEQLEKYQEPEETKNEGPYYGIPGHGILVLPGGSRINP